MISKFKIFVLIAEKLPALKDILFILANQFGNKEKFHLVAMGPSAFHIRIGWGLVDIRKGHSFELTVSCTRDALQILQRSLIKQSFQVQARLIA